MVWVKIICECGQAVLWARLIEGEEVVCGQCGAKYRCKCKDESDVSGAQQELAKPRTKVAAKKGIHPSRRAKAGS